MVDLVALKVEIAQSKYTGMTDAAIAAAINAATYSVAVDIDPARAVNALLFTAAGDWGSVCAVADGIITANQANRVRAVSVRELFRRTEMFDASNDDYWTLFLATVDALVTAGIMSAPGRSALVAMRTITQPLWMKFATRELDWSDIYMARNS